MFRSGIVLFLAIASGAFAQNYASDSSISIAGHDEEIGYYLNCASVPETKTQVCTISFAFPAANELLVLSTNPIPVIEWSHHKLVAKIPAKADGLNRSQSLWTSTAGWSQKAYATTPSEKPCSR